MTFSDLHRDAQLQQLQKYLLIATTQEKKLNSTKAIVKSTLGNQHAFLANVMSAVGMHLPKDIDMTDATAFMSAAKKTLKKYKSTPHEQLNKLTEIICWGCKGSHPWRDRRTKEITCPNKDKPGVAEHAKLMHKKYLEGIKEKKGGWVKKDKMKFAQLSAEEKESARQHFIAEAAALRSDSTPDADATSTTATSSARPQPVASGANSYPAILVLSYNNGKPLLPVQIQGQLRPHITLALGAPDQPSESCAFISVLYDSGTSMSSGYAGFWLPLLKANPQCLLELHNSDNGEYDPIVLGGIVTGEGGDMSNHTTQLNLVAKIQLRYEMVHHQPVTHTIAIGSSVGVNTIVGQPFIKSLKCVYDAHNNTVEARELNSEPFPVTNMFPQRYDTHRQSSHNPNYAAIVSKLGELEQAMLPAKKADMPSTLICGFQPSTTSHFVGDKVPMLRPTDPCKRIRIVDDSMSVESSLFGDSSTE